jgi:predicted alpha/beta superfamily hydrolase
MRHLIKTSVTVPYTGETRTIRILIPEGDGPMDVLYMHDGQNLFEDKTSYTGVSWGIIGTLDRLVGAGLVRDLMVVGIDNSMARADEYSVFEASPSVRRRMGGHLGGKGRLYADFVVGTVIPMIESSYNVNKSPQGRLIAGSSLGALISIETALINPGTFSVVGSFSLASWFSETSFLDMVKETPEDETMRHFVSVGRHETSDPSYARFNTLYIRNSRRYRDALLAKGIRDVHYIENDATHHESAWRALFPAFLLWARKNG